MKKTTAFFLSVGVLAMIVGSIGSVTYFKRAEKSMTETKKETYDIKNSANAKEVHLTLSGNTDFHILTENSDQVVMNSRSSIPISITSSLEASEKDEQLMITAKSTKKKLDMKGFATNIFTRSSFVSLTIPSTAERIVIDGDASGHVIFSNSTTKELAINLKNADISTHNINSDKLALETENGDLNIYSDVRSDEATFRAVNGNIAISDFTASNWNAISNDGDVSLDTVKGTAKIETKNGGIDAGNLRGDTTLKSINGDIILTGSDIPNNLTITSDHGDITIYTENILYDVTINTQSKYGDSTIFGKERTSYKDGKATRSLTLRTTAGDIYIEGPSEYEDEQSQ